MPKKGFRKAGAKPRSVLQRGYQGSSKQKKRRASRNAAAKKKKCPKGKEVHHKNRNPKDNSKKNLVCTTKKYNRSRNK